MMPRTTQPITPKSLNALQRLLQQNTPAQHRQVAPTQSYDYSKMHQSQQSNSGSMPYQKPSKNSRNESSYDVQGELLRVLSDKRPKKQNLVPFNNKVQAKPQRLADTYKQRRPPELQGLEEDGQQAQVQSARVQSKAQMAQREVQTTKAKHSPQHFLFCDRKPGVGGGGVGFNMFNSMNDMLRQYIQAKSAQDRVSKENVAGTGEGVKLNNEKGQCQSARNSSQHQHQRFQVCDQCYYCDKKLPRSNEQLERVYLRTAKMLNNFKAREAQWRQEKRALRGEVQFLKSLLKQVDILK